MRDLNVISAASWDLERLCNRLKVAKKRKACPDWCLPEEVWLLALCPEYVSTSRRCKEGLGYSGTDGQQAPGGLPHIRFVKAGQGVEREEETIDCTAAFEEAKEALIHCHRARCTPFVANLSLGFFVTKANKKQGLNGIRLIHPFCNRPDRMVSAVVLAIRTKEITQGINSHANRSADEHQHEHGEPHIGKHVQHERAMKERDSSRPTTTMNSTAKGDSEHHKEHGGEHNEEATKRAQPTARRRN